MTRLDYRAYVSNPLPPPIERSWDLIPQAAEARNKAGKLDADFFVRSWTGTVKFPADSAGEYIRTRFDVLEKKPGVPSEGAV